MRFRISREAMLKPLQIVGGVIEKRQTLPIVANVLLVGRGSLLTLTGTDLEVELTATTEVGSLGEGEITLPARKLLDICRALPEGSEIEMKVDEEKATIRSGKSRFTLATLPAEQFPNSDFEAGSFEFDIKQGDLKHLLEQTLFCMANQDVRYYLNGVLLELENTAIRAVATDGHRLAVCEVGADLVVGDKRQAIIPRKGVIELARLLGNGDEPCKVSVGNNQIRVALGDVRFMSKLVDGRFPDYERVIPIGGDKFVIGDRGDLRQALVRASILSNEKYRGIRLVIEDGTLRAMVNNPEQEEAEEEVEVETRGGAIEIGFNVAYLLDALGALKEERAEIVLSDPNTSCLIRGVGNEGVKYVVMPMRL